MKIYKIFLIISFVILMGLPVQKAIAQCVSAGAGFSCEATETDSPLSQCANDICCKETATNSFFHFPAGSCPTDYTSAPVSSCSAKVKCCCPAAGTSVTGESTGGAPQAIAVVPIDNPLPVSNFQQLLGLIINAALGVIGSIALLILIYGGFIWLTAAGNDQQISQGRNILMWAAIGLIIIFTSYALVRFVIYGIGAK
jgi:hypothetical protein